MDKKNSIAKAIVFIENNLYRPINVINVANEVSYSYYHFHRYFYACMGETIGSYIRSRRLSQAASDLVHTDKKILDIAISLYFESNEAFTRAFKARYKVTPKMYRQNNVDVLIRNRTAFEVNNYEKVNITPEIVDVEKIYVMGIRFNVSVSDNKNSIKYWSIVNEKTKDISCKSKYEIYESSKNCVAQKFSLDTQSTAFVGVATNKDTKLLDDFELKVIEGGRYAKFIHIGTIDTLLKTYCYIWGVWFAKSGYELSNKEDFECYTDRFLGPDNENSQIDIYFPL